MCFFFSFLHKSVISWVAEGIVVRGCSCMLAQDDRGKKEGRRAQRKILHNFSGAKHARSECVMYDTKREGKECKFISRILGQFESLLHKPAFFPGLQWTQWFRPLSNNSERMRTATHPLRRAHTHTHTHTHTNTHTTHTHKETYFKKYSSAPVHPVNFGTSLDNVSKNEALSVNDLFVKFFLTQVNWRQSWHAANRSERLNAKQINRLCKATERRRSVVYNITAFKCASLMTALINKKTTSDCDAAGNMSTPDYHMTHIQENSENSGTFGKAAWGVFFQVF